MNALKRSLLAIAIITAMLCIVPMACDSEASGEPDGFLLYQISPYGDDEGVSVYNYSDTAMDLKGYRIATKNYEMTVTESISVASDTFVTLYNKDVEGSVFAGQDPSHRLSDVCTLSDGKQISIDNIFINSNDYVQLKDSSGEVIDAVYYGKITVDEKYWSGDALTISSKSIAQRIGTYDTDSADDWGKYIPGRTSLPFDPNLKFDATVTPFLFPDSGGIPVLQALESAQKSIYITIYQFTNTNAYSLLCKKLDQGVAVNLLVEGEAYKYDMSTDVTYMKALVDHGATVRLIGVGDQGVTDRYIFVHAKYTIIDDEKVVITSENWTPKNLNGSITEDPYTGSHGNRGWGAIIESTDYTAYMKNVFEQDFKKDYGDVKDLLEVYPNVKTAKIAEYKEPQSATFASYKAKVTPVLSADNSYEAMKYYISNATERVYAQNQDLGSSYRKLESDSPVSIIAKMASKHLDCKLMFSTKVDDSFIREINQSTLIKTANMSKPTLHNKGLICDDYVWVSSINWTDNSFSNNREACAVIQSSEIAEFYAASFLKDFDKYYSYDGFRIDTSSIQESYPAGKEITFQVSVTPEGNYTYVWDLGDGSDPIETDVPRIACKPISTGDATAYVLTLTVTNKDTGQTATITKDYSVVKESDSGGLFANKYLIFAVIIIVLLAVTLFIKFSGLADKMTSNKKSTKTRSGPSKKKRK